MSALEVRLARKEWLPGQRLEGEVIWHFSSGDTSTLALKLLWYTEGVGDVDTGIVAQAPVSAAGADGRHRFAFELPQAPPSFQGGLFSLRWCVEVADERTKEFARESLTISPGGKPVDLASHPDLATTELWSA